MNIDEILKNLDKRLFYIKDRLPVGFASGKVGLCLYYYYTSRLLDDKDYEHKADVITDDILDALRGLKLNDIKNGIAGIGLSFAYLIQNRYVKGNVNKVLSDIDNKLFIQVCYPDNYSSMSFQNQLELLYYFTVRLKKQRKGSENEFLYRELIIYAVNSLSQQEVDKLFDEPTLFSVEYLPALYLYVLERCAELCRDKVYKILNELSLFLLTKIPLLHANRLYLLHAMNSVNKQITTEGWVKHINLLARETDVERIIESELSKNIFFANGLPSIYWLLSGLPEHFPHHEAERYKKIIVNKIVESPEWNLLLTANEEHFVQKCGLYTGYPGASLLIRKYYAS